MNSGPDSMLKLSAVAAGWLAGLREFIARQREQQHLEKRSSHLRPVPTSAERVMEERLIAEHLRGWLPTLPDLMAERRQANDAAPAIVITTSLAGLQAVAGLAGEPALAALLTNCCAVTEVEYRFWCKEQPDPEFAAHWNHWAWIKTHIPEARASEFAAYPLPVGSRHWLFRHGLAANSPVAGHSCRLYRWDGQAATLLTDSFREGVKGL